MPTRAATTDPQVRAHRDRRSWTILESHFDPDHRETLEQPPFDPDTQLLTLPVPGAAGRARVASAIAGALDVC